MDTTHTWQTFVDTGNILTYLDYRSQTPVSGAMPHEETSDGSYRNDGASAPGDKV